MKNKRFWSIIACITALSVMLACTLPFTIVLPTQESKEQPEPISPTAAPPIATALPPTAIPTTVSVAPVDWTGAWVVWMGGSLQQFDLDLILNNDQLTGNAAIGGGQTIAFFGQISADKRSVSGNWETTTGQTGTFTWYILDTYNQFNGNKGGSEQICGSRSIASRPTTCLVQ